MNITHIEHQLEHQVKVPTPNYMDISLMYGNESGRNADVYSLADVDLLFANIELDIYIDLGVVNIILIVLYSAIFIVGLLGNIFVIVAIIKFKSLRTLTNYFLLNLTVGDILVILVCIPVTLGSTVYKKWIYGQVLCKLTPFCQGTAVAVSVLSLLFICVSRCFAIYKPLRAKIIFSKHNVKFMIIVIWLLSFGSMCPLLIVNSVKTITIYELFDSVTCQESWGSLTDKHVFNGFIFCAFFVLPLTMMSIGYSVIGHTLWIGNSILMEGNGCQKKSNNIILKQRRRTVKMLICIVVIFGLCWLPYYIVYFWIDANLSIGADNGILTNVYPFVMLLGLSNSAVNPICYCILSRGFRRGFDSILCVNFLRRGGSFLRSSFKMKSTASGSIDTAEV
ncbi:hypothetical protein DPMN_031236 [Dreissena polymorpha]|uniref:G-protein coupled receptors family 1 profile domain-containing protein n=1 Tax=Dreissena polymorpha TaxID=45954 RepID=A0A9D4RIV8_DREPO|nr:hypothetical protein DPMN_031236 [Dreissena polymorpha]